MVGAATTGSHRVFEPGFPSGSNHIRSQGTRESRFRQWPAQLRDSVGNGRSLARLLAVCARRWRAALPRTAQLCREELQLPSFRDHGGMVEDGGQDRDQQRGILPSLSPSPGGHVRATLAYQGYESHGLYTGCWIAVVRRSVWPRQPARFAAEYADLSGIRTRGIGAFRRAASPGGRSIPRCGTGQDPSRVALRRACPFQAGPTHAILRNRGRDAALSDNAALGLACDRRPRPAGAAPADGGRLPRLDRQIRRPRRRWAPGISDALVGWLREHGLEGFW